jgi:glucan-binding YG repeat protein
MKYGWQSIGGYWYYFGGIDDGKMKWGWLKDGSAWYYLRTATNTPKAGPEGGMLASTSAYLSGKTYNFNSGGVCTNP